MKHHDYTTHVRWTGNTGSGTSSYRGYSRNWDVAAPGKPVIACSNDPLLGGDPAKMNPEDMLLSALSACHMLWYLHMASEAGLIVTAYEDSPDATGEVEANGAARFISATLRPVITLQPGADMERAHQIHHEIHKVCFIARSVNFPVTIEPRFALESV